VKARIRNSWRDRHTQEVDDWYKPGVSVSEFHQSQAFVRVLLGVEDVSPVTHRCTTPSTDYPIISRAGRTCGTCKCAFNDSGRYPGCAGFNAFLKRNRSDVESSFRRRAADSLYFRA